MPRITNVPVNRPKAAMTSCRSSITNAGTLAGYAARVNAANFEHALEQFGAAMRLYWEEKDFAKAYGFTVCASTCRWMSTAARGCRHEQG